MDDKWSQFRIVAGSTVGANAPRDVSNNQVLTPATELISDPRDRHKTTRKIIRPDIIGHNDHDSTARVGVTLVHQKRGTNEAKTRDWEDAEPFSLANLRAGQEAQFGLTHRETKRLFQALARLFDANGDLPQVLDEIGLVVDGQSSRSTDVEVEALVKGWLEKEPADFFKRVEQLRPDLVHAQLLRHAHSLRVAALRLFEAHMKDNDWNEHEWQSFFDSNRWIFGYGLSFRFLASVQDQPVYGGVGFSGRGGQRGDNLMRTEADVRFTVLVEIKRQDALLLYGTSYRPGVYHESKELAGAVAQVRANCETWLRQGSMTKEAGRLLEEEQNTFTHEPRAILVIGRTTELGGDPSKIGSFERYRQGMRVPDILTFDELLVRARQLVANDYEQSKTMPFSPVEPLQELPG